MLIHLFIKDSADSRFVCSGSFDFSSKQINLFLKFFSLFLHCIAAVLCIKDLLLNCSISNDSILAISSQLEV